MRRKKENRGEKMKISVLTMFPEFFSSFLSMPLVRRAVAKGKAEIEITDIKGYAEGSFRRIDDSPFGGGNGMIMRCQPVVDALEDVKTSCSKSFLLSPKGSVLTQKKVREISKEEHIILVCGHYEGVDARTEKYIDEQISVGDYVLSGGEAAAVVVIDSVVRLLDGVLRDKSADDESHENGLLEYPQYTRPAEYRGERVPDVLLSGNQKKIDEWRLKESLLLTKKYRPDMFSAHTLTPHEEEILKQSENE